MISSKKLKQIGEGIYFTVVSDEEVEHLSKTRLAICEPCDQNKFGICQMCWCPVKTKAHSPDAKCELNKWKE